MELNCESQDQDIKFRPIGLSHLSEKLLKRTKTELNETEENIKLGLKHMKERIQKEKLYLDKDEMLLKFLRIKKYKFSESFDSYKNYLRAVDICLKKLKVPNYETMLSYVLKNVISVLPYRDAEDRAIYVYRLGVYHKVGLTYEDCICLLIAISFAIACDPATQVGGLTLLVDAKEMIYSDAPVIISYVRWLIPLLKGFPGRVRRVDIVNQPLLFGTMINIIRPFLPSKLKNRIKVHGDDLDSLLKVYSPSILPCEYGGTMGPLNNEHFKKSPLSDQLQACYDYFEVYARAMDIQSR